MATTAVGALDEAPVLVVEFGEVGGRVARLSGTAVELGVDASGRCRRRETASPRSPWNDARRGRDILARLSGDARTMDSGCT